MAGLYVDFWRIVKPSAPKNTYVTDNPDDFKLYSNFSWYSKVMKGAGSRFQKYSQYKNMDGDVFVSRALDQIASEMTSEDSKTNLPFKITYQSEANEEVPDNVVVTLRAALRHWCDVQNLSKLSFDISRMTVKFGDCFFRKTSDFKVWEWIDPQDVIGIHIDKETGKPQFYQIRKSESTDKNAFGDAEIVPAAGVVHFTLSSGIGDNGPFGESVLFPTIKAFRHLTLLQDSVIIYRIVRAPERRVFSIDVGNMPPQRAKSYLEAIKNEIRQKRVPNESGGQEKIDSVYNPMCLTLDTRIPLLDGRTLALSEIIDEQDQGKQNWVYSVDPSTGSVVPGLISWAGITRRDAEIVKITLDDGKTITCTPDHKFPVLGRGLVEAKDLTSVDSLTSFVTQQKSLSRDADRSYTQVFDHELNEFVFVHRLVAEYFRDLNKHSEFTFSPEFEGAPKATVHHVNYDRLDNSPQNLTWMNHRDHAMYHTQVKREYWQALKTPERDRIKNKIATSLRAYYAELTPEEREALTARSSLKFKKIIKNLRETDPERYTCWREQLGAIRKARIEEDEFFREQLSRNLTCRFGGTQPLNVSRATLARFVDVVKRADKKRERALDEANRDGELLRLLAADNERSSSQKDICKVYKFSGRFTEKTLRCIYRTFGYTGWKHFAAAVDQYNHRVASVEHLTERVDTGCITVDGEHRYHDHHTFALEAGVFTCNSMVEDYFFMQTADGRGSKVDTLSGGENLGEIKDLNYFQNIFLQGLRIPSSYMRGSDDAGAQVQDGKVGVAYMEERNFFKYVQRLQRSVNPTYDKEFKAYLKSAGLKIDPNVFKIELNDPQNFDVYKQAEVDEKLMSNFNNIKEVPYIAARVKLARYLGWTEDEIQMNEEILRKELGIPEDDVDGRLTVLRMMYDPAWFEKRPEIKVDESWDNHVAASKRQVPEEELEGDAEAPPEDAEAAPEGEEADESGEEEAPADEPEDGGEATPSLDDMKKTLAG